jgi:hypothetical protein
VRILDLDLDFFLHGVETWKDPDGERLNAEEYPPWQMDDALSFLRESCLLDCSRPGFVFEHHSDLFYRWGEAIQAGVLTPPFELVHVDAHADLGLGDAAYSYLMTDLVFSPVEQRYPILVSRRPRSRGGLHQLGSTDLGDGNWLAFAIACGWIASLTYVYNRKWPEPGDLLRPLMEGFDAGADQIELVGVGRSELDKLIGFRAGTVVIERRDPPVPFTAVPWPDFQAPEPFEVVCLTRSPGYTPPEADPIFDAIRAEFIDESAFRR